MKVGKIIAEIAVRQTIFSYKIWSHMAIDSNDCHRLVVGLVPQNSTPFLIFPLKQHEVHHNEEIIVLKTLIASVFHHSSAVLHTSSSPSSILNCNFFALLLFRMNVIKLSSLLRSLLQITLQLCVLERFHCSFNYS